jgi:hypothetical protein
MGAALSLDFPASYESGPSQFLNPMPDDDTMIGANGATLSATPTQREAIAGWGLFA